MRNQPKRKGPARRPQSGAGDDLDEGEPEIVRTGTTIAERRAAQERAQREALIADAAADTGADAPDGPSPGPDGRSPGSRTLQTEAAGDSRRRDS